MALTMGQITSSLKTIPGRSSLGFRMEAERITDFPGIVLRVTSCEETNKFICCLQIKEDFMMTWEDR